MTRFPLTLALLVLLSASTAQAQYATGGNSLVAPTFTTRAVNAGIASPPVAYPSESTRVYYAPAHNPAPSSTYTATTSNYYPTQQAQFQGGSVYSPATNTAPATLNTNPAPAMPMNGQSQNFTTQQPVSNQPPATTQPQTQTYTQPYSPPIQPIAATTTAFYGNNCCCQPIQSVVARPVQNYVPVAYSQPTYTQPTYTQPTYITAGYPSQAGYTPVAYNSPSPILPVTSMPSNYYVGRGIIGQPKVYVPGQPIRNALRYLTP